MKFASVDEFLDILRSRLSHLATSVNSHMGSILDVTRTTLTNLTFAWSP